MEVNQQAITIADIFNKLVSIETKQDNFQKSLDKLTTIQNNVNLEVDILKRENSVLKSKVKEYEKQQRKNNLVIFGLGNSNKLLEDTVTKLNNDLEIDIKHNDINNIYAFGKSEPKIIKIEFTNYLKKLEVLHNTKKLKNKQQKYYITQDLTQEEQKARKILHLHKKQAEEQGLDAKIKNNKLYIKEKEYTWQQLEKLDSIEKQDNTESERIRKESSSEQSDLETEEQQAGSQLIGKSGNKNIYLEKEVYPKKNKKAFMYDTTAERKNKKTKVDEQSTRQLRANKQ